MSRRSWSAAALLLAAALCGCPDRAAPDAGAGAGVAVAADAGAGAVAGSVSTREPAAPPPPGGAAGFLSEAMRRFRMADQAFSAGRLDVAIREAEAATRADPELAVAWNLLGRAWARRFEVKKDAAAAQRAHRAFERVVKLDPNFLPAWQNLAELYRLEGRTAEAAEAYGRVLAIDPDHPAKAELRAFIEKAGQGGGESK